MNSNFEYYKVFYFVAKYKNLTRAAAALHTSQPAVTRTIRNLEHDLDCRLFTRSNTGMVLTPEGETLFRYVSEGCTLFLKGENVLSNMVSVDAGNVYISATETVLHCYLFDAMEEFNVKYPNVHFKILNNSSRDSVRMVKEGQVDMAVISAPIEEEKPLKQVELMEYADILICGKRYQELHERNVSLYELVKYPWISLTDGSFTRKFLEEYFKKYDLEFKPNVEVDTTDMILMAVRHNMGLGFIPPEFAGDALSMGSIIEVNIEEPFPDRNITLVYDTEVPQSAASREFRGFLEERVEIMHRRANGFRVY